MPTSDPDWEIFLDSVLGSGFRDSRIQDGVNESPGRGLPLYAWLAKLEQIVFHQNIVGVYIWEKKIDRIWVMSCHPCSSFLPTKFSPERIKMWCDDLLQWWHSNYGLQKPATRGSLFTANIPNTSSITWPVTFDFSTSAHLPRPPWPYDPEWPSATLPACHRGHSV